MKELVVEADRNNFLKVQSFIDEQLEDAGCPMLTQIAIDVAVEEIFVNIASYAYDKEIGVAVVQVEMLNEPLSVEITFIDNGKQYDPLAKPDPDITLGAKERKKGGLGIPTSRLVPKSAKKAGWASIWSRTAWTICAMNTGTERISLP